MSVSTPSRWAPSPTTNCTGSRASCGTGNGQIVSAPIANESWLSKPKTLAMLPKRPVTAVSVPNVAQTGMPVARGELRHAADVIGMLVGDEDRRERFGREAESRKAGGGVAARRTRNRS